MKLYSIIQWLFFQVTYGLEVFFRRQRRLLSFGKENPDKIFYIIRCASKTLEETGLFAIVCHHLLHIIYATERGWIPIVDLQNVYCQYTNVNSLGKENAWEYFFEQPAGYTLKDISNSKNIILSRRKASPGRKYDYTKLNLMTIKGAFRKYIKFNEMINKYIDSEYRRILNSVGGGGRIIGVLCRGTDMLYTPRHPIQPDVHEVIKKAEAVMHENNCSYVYIATESDEYYELFKTHFGNKLLYSEQKRFRNDEIKNVKYLSQIGFDRENDSFMRGIEYCAIINFLSKCTCFIGGYTSGSYVVTLMADKFEYEFIWKLGFNPREKIGEEIKRLIRKYIFGHDFRNKIKLISR